MQNDVWLNDNDYPDEKDIEEFGYDSPPDYDPLTIGYAGDYRPQRWIGRRLMLLVGGVFLVVVLVLPLVVSLLR